MQLLAQSGNVSSFAYLCATWQSGFLFYLGWVRLRLRQHVSKHSRWALNLLCDIFQSANCDLGSTPCVSHPRAPQQLLCSVCRFSFLRLAFLHFAFVSARFKSFQRICKWLIALTPIDPQGHNVTPLAACWTYFTYFTYTSCSRYGRTTFFLNYVIYTLATVFRL